MLIQRLKQIIDAWGRSGATSHAAATAYYAIFSLAPLILVAIAVASLFMGRNGAEEAILGQFGSTFGEDFRAFAKTLIAARQGGATSIAATIVGAILVVLGASGIFGALRAGLDEIFDSLPKDKKSGLLSNFINQLVSIGMVLSVGFLLLASLVFSTLLATLSGYLLTLLPATAILLAVADFLVTYILISLFLALMIAFLPSRRVGRRPALAGGLIAGAVFMLGKYAISLYFALAHPASTFGAASAMVVVVLWTYYLSLGLFMSALLARVFFIRDLPSAQADAKTPDAPQPD